ncbi:MAG: Uncharacterized protein G01um10145_364 [Microgenomates group bacterium Gr01-1014_5]|nr:MAG: Uncharacterized protein G01um10145_364 [Microgenomates group bacterium Gr01-1014_5]
MITDKLIAGALAFRERSGENEWFLVKSKDNNSLEIPKSDVRRGESSVSAAIRYLKESAGLRITVLEEAGRMNVTIKNNGQSQDARVIVYLMRQGTGKPEFPATLHGSWLKYSSARRKLELAREQKVLGQANDVLRQWQKEKKAKLK